MNLRVFSDMLMSDLRTRTAQTLDKYMKYRFGKKADLCVVSVVGDDIVYSTSAINGVEDSTVTGEKLCAIIRSKCGQQMLNTYGLTPPGKDLPILGLLPTPSLLKKLGIIEFFKFVKAWPGQSMIGNAVVVKYILWKENEDGVSN